MSDDDKDFHYPDPWPSVEAFNREASRQSDPFAPPEPEKDISLGELFAGIGAAILVGGVVLFLAVIIVGLIIAVIAGTISAITS